MKTEIQDKLNVLDVSIKKIIIKSLLVGIENHRIL